MKLLSWNVRGLGSAAKKRAMKEVILNIKPDIVVLQEVKQIEVDKRFISSSWGSRFKEWVLMPSEDRRGGILIVWDVR